MTSPAHAYSEQGIRRYAVEGMSPHPMSVTSLLKVLSPAPQLSKWIDKKICSAAIEAFQRTNDAEMALQIGIGSRWGDSAEADLGTSVHYLTEVSDLKTLGRTVDPQPVTDAKKVATYVKQWEKCREEHAIQILAAEVTLVNPMLGYAGTADRIAIVPGISDSPIVLDLKSGKNIYQDVALQCAGLSHCTQILHDDGTLGPIPWEIDRTRGIAAHVRPRSCRLIPLDTEKAWPYFEPLAKLALWKTETVKVLGEPLEPDEELALRANLRFRMKQLPPDLAESLKGIIKRNFPDGTTYTWTEKQLACVSQLFEPFEAESRDRKKTVLDKWGSEGAMALRLKILSVTGGRTSLLDDLVAEEIDALIGGTDDRGTAEVAA